MSLTGYLIIVLLVLGAIVALTIGSSWLLARLFCRPKRRRPTETPTDHDLAFESVTFLSHGVKLQGWFIPLSGNPEPWPTVVVAHGWSSNATRMFPVARLLHEAGFGVFLYDARGHGASGDDGPITLLKFAEDVSVAIDYLAGRSEVDLARLGIIGHSMGGSGVILAASMEPRLQALISSSAFADTEALLLDFLRAHHLPLWPFFGLIRYFIERWLGGTTITNVSPKNRIGQITIPLLLIHGEVDQLVSSSNLAVLYAQARSDYAQRELVPGRRHSNVLLDSRYRMQVIEFLNEHLLVGEQHKVNQE